MMDIETAIAIVWIGWVGSAGITATLLLSSKKCSDWPAKKIGVVSFSLATMVVICLLLLISL